jgi:RHS repeat-associated protein
LLKEGSTAYVYGLGGLPLEQINGSTVLWLHHDQLGSTRLVTDSTGVGQATYTYDAYGNLAAGTGTITNPLRFAGQYRDGESSLYYLRARYYDPSTGQFVTRDPANATTREPYGYVADNPLNATDPTGLLCWQFWDPSKCSNWATTPTNLPNDKLVASGFNLAYGAYKMSLGTAAIIAGTVIEFAVPVVGLTVGIPAQAYGAYMIGTGAFRAYRGYRQAQQAADSPTVSKSPEQYCHDLALDVAPKIAGSAIDFLGGLP